MNRRNFIKVVGTGSVILAATPLMMTQFTNESSNPLRPSHQQDDLRRTLISYAMLCPNPHNKQPWKVAFIGQDTIRLYVDQERLLPQTDPIHRQIHIGQGTFIESLVIAASQIGILATIDYFPEGEYDNQSIASLPVADIKLEKSDQVEPDPLFAQLLIRQSTKTPYRDEKLNSNQISALRAVIENSDVSLRFIDTPTDNEAMANYFVNAMEIEEQNKERSLETIAMFRFNDQEISTYRDGFGLEQNGVTGIKKLIAQNFFISRDKAESDPASFGKEGVKSVKNAVENTQHYAWLSTSDNSRKTQVELGRLYNRFNLTATALGIAQHPMSQILQEYKDMLPIQSEFKQHFGIKPSDTVQMLFRLGKADRTPSTARREVSSILTELSKTA